MKTSDLVRCHALRVCVLFLVVTILAVGSPRGLGQTPAPSVIQDSDPYEELSEAALDELVAPFALYPDALIALILPASTVPSDITLASRYLAGGGTNFEDQSWDDSVISLSRYPGVVTWMDENLAWTTAVGSAFMAQPADVMNSIQRLRAAAAAAGNLEDTPEQRIVREVVDQTTYIRILPAQPNVIYIPIYDPVVVYYRQPLSSVGNIISFGAGFALGSWLNYDCDWRRRGIYRGDYNPDWNHHRNHRGGHRNVVRNTTEVDVTNITNTSASLWQPTNRSRSQMSRRKDTYNQRVHTANREIRAARASGNRMPTRETDRIKALPQPEPRVRTGENTRNRAKVSQEARPVRAPQDRGAYGTAPRTAAQREAAAGTIPPTPGTGTSPPGRRDVTKKGASSVTPPAATGTSGSLPKNAPTPSVQPESLRIPRTQPQIQKVRPRSTTSRPPESSWPSTGRPKSNAQRLTNPSPTRQAPARVPPPSIPQQSNRKAGSAGSQQPKRIDAPGLSSQPQQQKFHEPRIDNPGRRPAPGATSQWQMKRQSQKESRQPRVVNPIPIQPKASSAGQGAVHQDPRRKTDR